MQHTLPDLPFASDALAPWISAETFSYHHGKHHNAYVQNLNRLLEGSGFEDKSLDELVRCTEGGLFNNAAQHYNHSFFWKCLRPSSDQGPTGDLALAIDNAFGSLDAFREAFSTAAKTLFGSGWTWLVKKAGGELAIVQTSNAGCPLRDGDTPLLTLDVWEHAYYIDHRNARPAFIEGFWKHVNWDFVASNYGS